MGFEFIIDLLIVVFVQWDVQNRKKGRENGWLLLASA